MNCMKIMCINTMLVTKMSDIIYVFGGFSMLLLSWGIVQRWTAPRGNISIYQYRLEIAKIQLQKEQEKTKKVKVQLKIEQEKTKRLEMQQLKNEVKADEN